MTQAESICIRITFLKKDRIVVVTTSIACYLLLSNLNIDFKLQSIFKFASTSQLEKPNSWRVLLSRFWIHMRDVCFFFLWSVFPLPLTQRNSKFIFLMSPWKPRCLAHAPWVFSNYYIHEGMFGKARKWWNWIFASIFQWKITFNWEAFEKISFVLFFFYSGLGAMKIKVWPSLEPWIFIYAELLDMP